VGTIKVKGNFIFEGLPSQIPDFTILTRIWLPFKVFLFNRFGRGLNFILLFYSLLDAHELRKPVLIVKQSLMIL